jgi:hypothetical protein
VGPENQRLIKACETNDEKLDSSGTSQQQAQLTVLIQACLWHFWLAQCHFRARVFGPQRKRLETVVAVSWSNTFVPPRTFVGIATHLV